MLKMPLLKIYLKIFVLASLLLLSSCAGQPSGPGRAEGQATGEEKAGAENGAGNTEQDLKQEPDNTAAEPAQEELIAIPRVGIYSGRGSWDVNVEAFKNFFSHYGIDYAVFDEEEAAMLDFREHFEIILFPGGFAAEYKNFIADHGNIRAFIEEGGLFVGSCAGAYYASDILRWQGTDHEYPLKLFDGRGVGPLSGLVGWGEIAAFNLEQDHPANEGFEQSLDFYYFDGPYFEPYGGSVTIEVLARYDINDEPAVIAGRLGEGKYLLLGPHPELGGYSSDSPDFNKAGGEGAVWPWLHSSLLWLANW